METLTFAIAAGETKYFQRAGKFLEIIDAAAAVDVGLYDATGSQADDMRSALSGLFIEAPFAAFEVTSATAQTVTLLFGDGRGGSRRQPGTVRVVDQGVERTTAGTQYYGLARRIANGAKVGLCGILAGAKAVSVKRIAFVSNSAAGLCTLLYGTGAPLDTPTSLAVFNKSLGGANALATRVSGLAATINPTVLEVPGVSNLASVYVAQNVQQELPLTTPFLIPAGFCLLITSSAINTDIAMLFDAEEI